MELTLKYIQNACNYTETQSAWLEALLHELGALMHLVLVAGSYVVEICCY